ARRLVALLLVVRWPRRVAEARGLLGGGQREEPVERSRRGVDRRGGVAALGQACGRGDQRERRRIAAGDLVPLEGHRDPRVACRPHRPGRGDRAVLRVLVVVEEDPVALFLPPLARRQLGRAPPDLAGAGPGRPPYLIEAPAPPEARAPVHAARARRPGPGAHVAL